MSKRTRSVARPLIVYSVTFTEFIDDYKARGDDWSSTDAPILFASRKSAEAYVHKELMKRITTHLEEHSSDEAYEKYWKKGVLDTAMVEADFDELADDAQQGEFVPRSFDWAICECEVRN